MIDNYTKWNVTPHIRRGNNNYLFAALYCSCLGFNALLALQTKEGGNNFLLGKYSVLGNFLGQIFFSKIVTLIIYEGLIRLEVNKVFYDYRFFVAAWTQVCFMYSKSSMLGVIPENVSQIGCKLSSPRI